VFPKKTWGSQAEIKTIESVDIQLKAVSLVTELFKKQRWLSPIKVLSMVAIPTAGAFPKNSIFLYVGGLLSIKTWH
jgi:hypothetical protein